jgi:hypothetical protein
LQALSDLVGTIADTFTRTIWIVILGGVVVVGIVTAMIGYAAPAVVEDVGARAERISEKAIEAAREESRAHAMAKDGWGYSSSSASAETGMADTSDDASSDYEAGEAYDSSSDHDSGGEYVDDWGAGAE